MEHDIRIQDTMGYKRDKVDEPTAGQYNSKLMKFGCDHGDVIGSEVSKIYWIKLIKQGERS